MRRAALLVPVLLLAVPPLAAQEAARDAAQETEWSADEQAVVEWLTTFNEEAYAYGAGEFLSWMHPEFTSWNYAEKRPVEMESFATSATEFFESDASIRLGTRPMSVQVVGDVAIAHTWYREAITGGEGEGSYFGRWTIVLKKLDGDWKHLAWTWTQEKVDPEKVKKEKADG